VLYNGKRQQMSGIFGWRSARLVIAAFIGVTSSAAVADIKRVHVKPVTKIIDAAAERYIRENPQAAAITIGVVVGASTFQVHRGTLKRGETILPGQQTLYPVASITKTFTGTLVAQAAVEKRLLLSDDVRNYLEGDYPNLEFEGRPILVSDLLNHRSGLPFMFPDRPELTPEFKGDRRPYTVRVNEAMKTYGREEFLADLQKFKLSAAPGSQYQYSNAAAQLAGYILENIYGKPYEQLLRMKILSPLKMNSTTISLSYADRERLAPGWDDQGKLAILPEGAEAAGALKSTIDDMLKYVGWQIEETDPAVRLSHQRVWTAKGPVFGDKGTFGIGLNWQVAELSGRRAIFQDGMIEGYSTLVVLQPELKFGVVLMTNQLDGKSAGAQRNLMKELLRDLDAEAVPLPE
jgi:CubicO group peptidase (beta-lactamase class C family)